MSVFQHPARKVGVTREETAGHIEFDPVLQASKKKSSHPTMSFTQGERQAKESQVLSAAGRWRRGQGRLAEADQRPDVP